MVLHILAALLATQPVALPALGQAPDFAMRDQRGQVAQRRDLAGHVWVADFIYTSCKDECPVQTSRLAHVQRQVAGVPGVHFVSFSVDPGHDTPARLLKYAERHRVDQRTWRFLTARSIGAVQEVARGLNLPAGVRQHARHYVLIDTGGRIRGYYSQDAARLRDLVRDIRGLAAGP